MDWTDDNDWPDDDIPDLGPITGQSEEVESLSGELSFGAEDDDYVESLSITGTLERDAFELEDFSDTPIEYGGATAGTLQHGRFSHMSSGVREAAKHISGNKVPDYLGIDPITVIAAQEEFAKTIGGDPREWAKHLDTSGQLGGVVTKIDPKTMKPIGTQSAGIGRGDYITALSMMGTTGNEYLEKGPGSNLVGNTSIESRREEADEDMRVAIQLSEKIADKYISAGTIGTDIEGTRSESIRTEIVNRMMKSVGGPVLPLPNELKTKGLVRTQASGRTGQGTRFTSIEHTEAFKDHLTKNDQGYYNISALAPEDVIQEYWATKPSLKDSLFPLTVADKDSPTYTKDRREEKRIQQRDFNELMDDARFVRETLRQQQPEHRDESAGQKSHAGFDRPYGEQADAENLRNEASILDLDLNAEDYSGNMQGSVGQLSQSALANNTKPNFNYSLKEVIGWKRLKEAKFKINSKVEAGQTLEGSSKGGMYGEKGKSEVQDFVSRGLTIDEQIAKEELEWNKGLISFNPELDAQKTDLEEYQEYVASEQAAGRFAEQGTDAWKAERKGKISASWLVGATEKHRVEDLATGIYKSERGISGFKGNSDTREGNEGEAKVKNALMAKLNRGKSKEDQMHFEEAFFERDAEDNIGASTDGRLFNPDGSSAGNVELKFLSSGQIDGSLDKYYEQMQFQMMVNGETQTHFGVLNKDDNQLSYELVKADEKTQDRLRNEAKKALAMSVGLEAKDIDIMKTNRKKKKRGGSKTALALSEDGGQSESFKLESEEEETPMTGYKDAGGKKAVSKVAKMNAAYAKEMEAERAEEARIEELVQIGNADLAMSKVAGMGGKVNAAINPLVLPSTATNAAASSIFAKQMIENQKKSDARDLKDTVDTTVEDIEARKFGPASTTHGAVEHTKSVEDVPTKHGAINYTNPNPSIDNAAHEREMARNASKSQNEKLIDAVDNANTNTSSSGGRSKEGIEDLSKAAREASKDLKDFGKGAVGVVKELVGLVKSGTDSVISTEATAKLAGLDAADGRGISDRLKLANLSGSQANSLISSAGELSRRFKKDPNTMGAYLANIAKIQTSPEASDQLRALKLPTAEELQGLKPDERMGDLIDKLNTLDDQGEKTLLADAYEMENATIANNVTGQEIVDARDKKLSDEMLARAHATDVGLKEAGIIERDTRELTSQVGEDAGFVAGITGSLAGLLGGVTSGVAGKTILKKAGAAGAVSTAAKFAKVAKVGAGIATPAAAVAIGSAVVREVADIEDDGGKADSAMDVLDFAAAGAGVGAMVGAPFFGVGAGVGAAVGGAIGTGVGVLNEAYEYFSSDDETGGSDQEEVVKKSSKLSKQYTDKVRRLPASGDEPVGMQEAMDSTGGKWSIKARRDKVREGKDSGMVWGSDDLNADFSAGGIPSKDIVSPPSNVNSNGKPQINVEVNTQVTKDKISTSVTEDNREIHSEEEDIAGGYNQ